MCEGCERDRAREGHLKSPRNGTTFAVHNIFSHGRYPASGRRAAPSAFTVIELLVVVVIAFIILALFGVLWKRLDTRNKRSAAQTQLAHLQTALQDCKTEVGSYPDSLSDISNRLPRAFSSFTNGIPLDPWGEGYRYSTHNLTYTLYSLGPDGTNALPEDYITPGHF